MFKAIKTLNKKEEKPKLFIIEDNKMINDDNLVTEKITEYYDKIFKTKNIETVLQNIKPVAMREPFTTEEVKYAINKLKNNKRAGLDDIQAEHLKSAPNIIMEKIAEIFNEMAITGNFPNEITQGILIPLQKQGKEKGYVENTRPIILLNTIRKILAIIMLKRIINKLNEEIPLTQSAYRSGRSTTENVFVLRTLIDKALSLTNYELNILFLDMSKAFDSIDHGGINNHWRQCHVIKCEATACHSQHGCQHGDIVYPEPFIKEFGHFNTQLQY